MNGSAVVLQFDLAAICAVGAAGAVPASNGGKGKQVTPRVVALALIFPLDMGFVGAKLHLAAIRDYNRGNIYKITCVVRLLIPVVLFVEYIQLGIRA